MIFLHRWVYMRAYPASQRSVTAPPSPTARGRYCTFTVCRVHIWNMRRAYWVHYIKHISVLPALSLCNSMRPLSDLRVASSSIYICVSCIHKPRIISFLSLSLKHSKKYIEQEHNKVYIFILKHKCRMYILFTSKIRIYIVVLLPRAPIPHTWWWLGAKKKTTKLCEMMIIFSR